MQNNISRITSYDAFSRILTETDAYTNQIRYSYDDVERSVTMLTPEGVETKSIRNAHGETIEIHDGNQNRTQYDYDLNGNLFRVTEAVGTTEETVVSRTIFENNDGEFNRVFQTIDGEDNIVQYTYDAANRVTYKTVDPDGLNIITHYEYDGIGRKFRTTEGDGSSNQRVTEIEYNTTGQVAARTLDPDGLNIRTEYTYDGQNNTLTTINAAGTAVAQTIEYRYDKLGRREFTILDPDGLNLTTNYIYDDNDNVVAKIEGYNTTDPHVTRYVYNSLDNLKYTLDALGNVIEHIYNDNQKVTTTKTYYVPIIIDDFSNNISESELESALDARVNPQTEKDQLTTYIHDDDGRITDKYYAPNTLDEYIEHYEYDGNGNVISHTDGNGDTSYFKYDQSNRVTRSVDGEGYVIDTEYDSLGNVKRMIQFMNSVSLPLTLTPDFANSSLSTPETNSDPISGDRLEEYFYDNAGAVGISRRPTYWWSRWSSFTFYL